MTKEKKPPKEERKEEPRTRRKRKCGAVTLKRAKDETAEIVNVEPKEVLSDAEEQNAPEEEAPLTAEDKKAPAAAEAPAAAKEKAAKGVVLKHASDPGVKEKAEALLGKESATEKKPHPQADRNVSEKASKQESDDDPGAKAPHGGTDEEDDEVIEAQLRSLSQLPDIDRDRPRQPSEIRSDQAACDEDERRSSVPSSQKKKKKKKKKTAATAKDALSGRGEESIKRKKKSKHGSKKAAKKDLDLVLLKLPRRTIGSWTSGTMCLRK